mmetsp:Transcript_86588/g.229511  ORF Transcript_86588/g.229511 Transcript_86588/m.229511 type:complete len:288 (-) Transcript_86588:847-1710(-)
MSGPRGRGPPAPGRLLPGPLSRPEDGSVGLGGVRLPDGDGRGVHGVGLTRGVLPGVNPDVLCLRVDAQATGQLEHEEDDAGEDPRPGNYDADHDEVRQQGVDKQALHAFAILVGHAAEAAPAVEVLEADAPVEEERSKHAPDAAGAVDRDSVHRVVDLELLEQHGASLVHKSADEPDREGTSGLHVAAGGRDGHQAGQDAVAQAAHVVGVREYVPQEEDGHAASRGGDRRVHGHLGGQQASALVHRQGGAAVETIPTEPQDEGAQHDKRQAVRVELLGVLEAALAWS